MWMYALVVVLIVGAIIFLIMVGFRQGFMTEGLQIIRDALNIDKILGG